MSNAIRGIVQDLGWTNLAIGLSGNLLFICSSIVFVPAFEQLRSAPIGMFICAATLMLIGVFGPLRVSFCED